MTLRRRGPRALDLALTPLRESWAPETVLAEVQRAWSGVVGDAIAAEAEPVRERAGVLTINCSASVWAQELDLMAPDILGRLNAAIRRGRISRLKCISGA